MIKQVLRHLNDRGLGLALAVIVAMCAGFGVIVWLAMSATGEAITSIDDPTERGLAYVAAAIVAHAFLQSSGSNKSGT